MPEEPTSDHIDEPTPPNSSMEADPSFDVNSSFETDPSFEVDSSFDMSQSLESDSTSPASGAEGDAIASEPAASAGAIPWIGGEPELEPARTGSTVVELPPPVRRSFSPWWALMILPIGIVIGWGIGRLPTRAAKPTPVNVRERAAATTPNVIAREAAPPAAAKPSPSTATPETEPAQKPKEVFSQWTSLQIAMVESDLHQKPILIDFSAEWCGPCHKLKEQVFNDQVLGPAVQAAVIPVSIVDRVREDGRNPIEIQNLQNNFQVTSFPTLVVLMPSTGKAIKTTGFATPEETMAWITEAAQSVR